MEIVPMSLQDHTALVRLWSSFPGNAVTDADSPGGFAAFLERNGEFCFTALVNDEVAGSVMGGSDGRRGYIYHLAVGSRHQEKGIGAALMEKVEGALAGAGIEKAHLFIYSNNPAVEFYRKIGWHVRTDITVMSRMLRGSPGTETRG